MGNRIEHYKLSYPVWSVNWNGKQICKRSFDDICTQLDDMLSYGITELMLTGYHCEEPSDFDMDEETLKLGNALRERGMKGAQHHSIAATWANPEEPQDEVIRRLKKCIDYTANMNADVVVFHAMKRLGGSDSGFVIEKEMAETIAKHSENTLWEIIWSNLHAAGEYAKERGILIAIENLDRFTPWCNMEYLPKLVRGAESENVGFCLDTGHAWCGGVNPADWVPIMGDKLFTTHVHDNHGLPKKFAGTTGVIDVINEPLDEHLPPGFGTISWFDFIRALRENNYTRTVNFETNGWQGLEKEDSYRCAIKYWRICEKLSTK